MKKIPLTQGKYALVDDEDFEYLNQWKWCYAKTGYAVRSQSRKEYSINSKRKSIFIHRVVNKTPDGWPTDHINHNRLDNRKGNLRTVTTSQNVINKSGLQTNNNSGHTGVSFVKSKKRWLAQLTVRKRRIHVGSFKLLDEAIKARKVAENKYFTV